MGREEGEGFPSAQSSGRDLAWEPWAPLWARAVHILSESSGQSQQAFLVYRPGFRDLLIERTGHAL